MWFLSQTTAVIKHIVQTWFKKMNHASLSALSGTWHDPYRKRPWSKVCNSLITEVAKEFYFCKCDTIWKYWLITCIGTGVIKVKFLEWHDVKQMFRHV